MTRVTCFGLLLAVVAGACTPLSPMGPFHVMETAPVLDRGRFTVTAAGGAGNFKDIGGGLGGAVRARMGIGTRSEVGVEGALIGRLNKDDPTPERPWLGQSAAWLGKITYKLELASWISAQVSPGVSHSATGNAAGGDIGLVSSTPGVFWGGFRPYLGVRGLLAVPVGRDRDEAGGVTKGLVIAGGAQYTLSPNRQLFFELGLMNEWNRGYFSTDADPMREIQSTHKPGGYLGVGVAFLMGP